MLYNHPKLNYLSGCGDASKPPITRSKQVVDDNVYNMKDTTTTDIKEEPFCKSNDIFL